MFQYENISQSKIQKILDFIKNIYRGLLLKDPYCLLLTDRDALKEMAFMLPKEERNVVLFKNGLIDCQRRTNKSIAEYTGVSSIKVPKLEQSARNKMEKIYVKKGF